MNYTNINQHCATSGAFLSMTIYQTHTFKVRVERKMMMCLPKLQLAQSSYWISGPLECQVNNNNNNNNNNKTNKTTRLQEPSLPRNYIDMIFGVPPRQPSKRIMVSCPSSGHGVLFTYRTSRPQGSMDGWMDGTDGTFWGKVTETNPASDGSNVTTCGLTKKNWCILGCWIFFETETFGREQKRSPYPTNNMGSETHLSTHKWADLLGTGDILVDGSDIRRSPVEVKVVESPVFTRENRWLARGFLNHQSYVFSHFSGGHLSIIPVEVRKK